MQQYYISKETRLKKKVNNINMIIPYIISLFITLYPN